MRIKRSLTSLFLFSIVAIAASSGPSFAADLHSPYSGDYPNVGISFVDDAFVGSQSFLQHGSTGTPDCSNGRCNQDSGPDGFGQIFYRPCQSQTEKFCIQNLSLTSKDGSTQSASFYANSCGIVKNFNVIQGEITGGSTSIWQTPDGKFFAVEAFSKLHWNPKEAKVDSLEMGVAAVRPLTSKLDTQIGGPCHSEKEVMIWSQLETSIRIQLVVRVPDNLGGFFMGRIASANITQSKSLEGSRTISVSGNPEVVPKLAVVTPKVSAPNYIRASGADGVAIPDYDGRWYKDPTFSQIVDWALGQSMNKVTSYEAAWRIYSSDPASSTYSRCAGKVPDLLGWGTTNAMFYDSNPPEFKNQSIDFKIAGAHFDSVGVGLQKGNYELRLTSAFARCLYNLSSKPVYASVSTVSEGSGIVVSTTVVTDKNGFLNLNANGITFSRKTLRIKVSNEKTKVLQTVGSKSKN